jgi:hypothetical protein
MSDAERAAHSPVRQAVVLDGPHGRALYLGAHAAGIEGMAEGEARALIERLMAFATQERLASRAEELHLRALLEPYVTLSSHTAPDVRSSTCTKRQCAKRLGLARRTRASHSLARLGFRRRRLNLSHAQRTRTASTRFSVQ